MVNYENSSPFIKMSLSLSDILFLLKNIKHPDKQIQDNIKDFLALLFDKDKEEIDMNLLKNDGSKHISVNPYLPVEEIDCCKVIIYWGTINQIDENYICPLFVNAIVPESLWMCSDKRYNNGRPCPRVFLILHYLYSILTLANISSIGALECTSITPTVVQGTSGYSMQFITAEHE